jgi:hypothetical protein
MSKDDFPKRPTGPISSSDRTIVAFPFSTVKTEEAAPELRELAAIVTELAETLTKLEPSQTSDELLQRARAVSAKLG